uniref:J domain-containing protein n=1 Tax=Parastrongyloides trichosuri TaxID=131310 RepID=A0A0N4ZUL1_PARTI
MMLRCINFYNVRYFSMTSFALQNHYETLGVKKDAKPKEIKKAFYDLSKKYHPDMNPGDHKKSAEMFTMIAKAYEVLSNDFSRKEYDKTISPPPKGYGDITSRRFTQRKKEYTDVDIDLSDLEAFQRSARMRRGQHVTYDMPDEFFARFGGKKFKTNFAEDDIPHAFNYKDKMTAEREAEELKILKEIEEQKKKERYPLPTFEQLLQEQNRKRHEELRKTNIIITSILGTIFCILLYSRL